MFVKPWDRWSFHPFRLNGEGGALLLGYNRQKETIIELLVRVGCTQRQRTERERVSESGCYYFPKIQRYKLCCLLFHWRLKYNIWHLHQTAEEPPNVEVIFIHDSSIDLQSAKQHPPCSDVSVENDNMKFINQLNRRWNTCRFNHYYRSSQIILKYDNIPHRNAKNNTIGQGNRTCFRVRRALLTNSPVLTGMVPRQTRMNA